MQGLSIIVGNMLLRAEKKQLMPLSNLPHPQFANAVFIGIVTEFVRVLKNLESPGILLWHFAGPWKKATGPRKFWKSAELN